MGTTQALGKSSGSSLHYPIPFCLGAGTCSSILCCLWRGDEPRQRALSLPADLQALWGSDKAPRKVGLILPVGREKKKRVFVLL